MASPDAAVAGKLAELSHSLGRRTPVVDQIAGSIRGMIVAGDLKPGDRVVESRIARQIGVGQPTVRESLVALEHQRLVVRKANQGCIVTVLTHAEIAQLPRVRDRLEGMAIELAMEIALDCEIQKLVDAALLMQMCIRDSTKADSSVSKQAGPQRQEDWECQVGRICFLRLRRRTHLRGSDQRDVAVSHLPPSHEPAHRCGCHERLGPV